MSFIEGVIAILLEEVFGKCLFPEIRSSVIAAVNMNSVLVQYPIEGEVDHGVVVLDLLADGAQIQ